MAKSATKMSREELLEDRKVLLRRIRLLEAETSTRSMDVKQFQSWAAQQFMADLCSGKTPHDAMWLIVNQAALNEVWGGSKHG